MSTVDMSAADVRDRSLGTWQGSDPGRGLAGRGRGLPGLRAVGLRRVVDANPRVDGDTAAGAGEDRVQVELRDLRQLLAEQAETDDEVFERAGVGRRRAAKAGDERARLP